MAVTFEVDLMGWLNVLASCCCWLLFGCAAVSWRCDAVSRMVCVRRVRSLSQRTLVSSEAMGRPKIRGIVWSRVAIDQSTGSVESMLLLLAWQALPS